MKRHDHAVEYTSGERRELLPRQLGLDGGDIGKRNVDVLAVAAGAVAAHTAHDADHLGADGDLAIGAGGDDADGLEAGYGVPLVPLALAHVHLGVVHAEGVHVDEHLALDGFRLGYHAVFEDLWPTEAGDHDCLHCVGHVDGSFVKKLEVIRILFCCS